MGAFPLVILAIVIKLFVIGSIEQLQYERSAGDDSGASGQEAATYDAFEDGAFAAGLTADDDYLGEVEGGVLTEGS